MEFGKRRATRVTVAGIVVVVMGFLALDPKPSSTGPPVGYLTIPACTRSGSCSFTAINVGNLQTFTTNGSAVVTYNGRTTAGTCDRVTVPERSSTEVTCNFPMDFPNPTTQLCWEVWYTNGVSWSDCGFASAS